MKITNKIYLEKLKGAIIGRFAGCALGAPVEMMELGKLRNFCKKTNQVFPPTDYFKVAPDPDSKRYSIGKGRHFTSSEMNFLSTDDDIAYTLLSLLMLEEKGINLTTNDVADYWMKYLPIECTFTAERTTLQNLYDGIEPELAGTINNEEFEYIGAAIRIDGYGYINPGKPELAVKLAYQDAFLSHREDGLYSALYFSALVALSFTSIDIVKSMYEALKYIPKTSNFYEQVKWALSIKDEVLDYQTANYLVTNRFKEMSWAHAVNNACLTIWGINIGKKNFEKGITETVAMGYDNDCTAATVGSVLGAYFGINSIDEKWYKPWNNTILSYLNGIDEFQLDDVINRFYKLGLKI